MEETDGQQYGSEQPEEQFNNELDENEEMNQIEDDDFYKNNHDLIGVEGILRA